MAANSRNGAVRQIIAMGGGGFSMEPENLALDRYVIEVARGPEDGGRPKVCFLATASGDAEEYIERFYESFSSLPCRAKHLALFGRSVTDLRSYVLGCDVIYVGGGSTANLLAVWRVHGLDTVLRQAWEAGVVLCGLSAGSLCWYEAGVTDSFGPELAPLHDGLGLLPGSHCPHYDGEVDRRPTYHRCVADGLPAGVAADDGVGLHYKSGALHRIVSSRPDAAAYRVECIDGQVHETRLSAESL